VTTHVDEYEQLRVYTSGKVKFSEAATDFTNLQVHAGAMRGKSSGPNYYQNRKG